MRHRELLSFWLSLVALFGWARSADSRVEEGFETAETAWKIAQADAAYRLLQHARVEQPVHGGQRCEHFQIAGRGGTHVYAAYDIGGARVIDELAISLWVRGDRPGLLLAGRVVLPRTIDPSTGNPVRILVYGSTYRDAGRWQRLVLDQLPLKAERQSRVFQSGFLGSVDTREAYVESVLLNLYAGPGTTSVWADDLSIDGYVGQQAEGVRLDTAVKLAGWETPNETQRTHPPPRIEVNASVLTINGQPIFPRVIEHQGESFELLRTLGFNTIKLAHTATPQQRTDAVRHGMWLICPPPDVGDGTPIDPSFDAVLFWHLGDNLTQQQLEPKARQIRLLRSADGEVARPIVCNAQTGVRGFSRQADVLIGERHPLLTSLEMTDYVTWLRQLPLLARPGTPVWAVLPTEAPASWRWQQAILSNGAEVAGDIDPPQLRHLALTAVATGARGLQYLSRSRLDASGPPAARRAKMLELLNIELQLIEKWLAAGRFVTTGQSRVASMDVVMLQSERSRLILVIPASGGSQYVPASPSPRKIDLVVPGVPATNRAFLISASGLQTLANKRVAGGMRVELQSVQGASAILLSDDPRLIQAMAHSILQRRQRAVQLEMELAFDQLQRVEATVAKLDEAASNGTAVADEVRIARELLQRARESAAGRSDHQALALCRQADRQIAELKRTTWTQAISQFGPPTQFPLLASFHTLPDCYRWFGRVRDGRWSQNLLPGGDFENLEAMLAAGWRHTELHVPPIVTQVALAREHPRTGRHSLKITAQPEGADTAELVESVPVWVTSAPINVQAGQLVQIHGWAHVPRPIKGSVDGLMVFDSIAGPSLARRIGHTNGWEEFTLYRAATNSGTMSATFALAGIGEAWIDDVTLRVLE